MSRSKLVAALVSVVALVVSALPASASDQFPDVDDTHPFHDEIAWLASAGITTGYADGTFRPTANVSRQAIAAYLYRYAGEPAFTPPGTATFSDVPTTHPFYTEIEWLSSTGVTAGYADGTFGPTANVSRQAIAAYLYRYAGEPAFTPPGTATFSDVPTSQRFFDEIEWLNSMGVTTGYADGIFRPAANVSRQAIAAYLYRYDQAFPFTDCASQTQLPESECDALIALYDTTSGPSWWGQTGWKTTGTPCSWYGVTCSPTKAATSTVISLGLYGNNLSGSIPWELGNLTNLAYLGLYSNSLSGSIPSELGNLTNLAYLGLYSNSLSGSIPSELGNLTNLEVLHLGSNGLSGVIPPALGNLTSLTWLGLSYNGLSGSIAPQLGNLTSLKVLGLYRNNLSGLVPVEIGSLTNLTILSLGSNGLSGAIPTELGNLTNLAWLSLGSNGLSGSIPLELGNLTSLTYLNLGYNGLSGPIPSELGNLTNLVFLLLNGNGCLTSSSPTLTAFLNSLNPFWADGCL